MSEANSLFYQPAHEIRRRLASKEITCVDLTEQFLNRIEKLNPEYRAYQCIDRKGAIKSAKEIDQGKTDNKLLAGIPSVIPDVLHMEGTYTTFGSKVFEDHKDLDNSIEVELLKKAGSVILGKGNVAEFGLSYDTVNYKGEISKNPWNLKYSPGGGGAGTATAVSTGLAPLAVATDFNGSLRISASFCGLYGLMPTRGRVPIVRKHLLPFTERMFYRKGILSRNTRDMAMMFNVLAQPDERDPHCCCEVHADYEEFLDDDPKNLRIAYSPNLNFIPVDPVVQQTVASGADQLRQLGHNVEEMKVPIEQDVLAHFMHLFTTDRYLMVMKYIDEHPEVFQLLHDETKGWLKFGHEVTGVQYSLGISYMGELIEALNTFFQTHDFILTPAAPIPSFPLGQHPTEINGEPIHPFVGLWSFLIPCNISGHPAITIPCGLSPDGIPIGMQLIGRKYSEGLMLSLSHQLEKIGKGFIPPLKDQ